MSTSRGKLGSFLKEVIDWRWDEFCEAEKDANFKGFESIVFSLVRTCAEGKLGAIRTAIDRVDGKIETPIDVIYPKFIFLYPHAEKVTLPQGKGKAQTLLTSSDVVTLEEELAEQAETHTVVTLTLRQTLDKMIDQPRMFPALVLKRKDEVENDKVDKDFSIPRVKDVIAANLLTLAESKFDAITEVFDQIDGKLVETVRVLGDDVYITSYVLEAPIGASKNADGIYQLEAPQISETWKVKFKPS